MHSCFYLQPFLPDLVISLSSQKRWSHWSSNGDPNKWNPFPCNKRDPQSPRGTYSINTWHGQFVHACMHAEMTHARTDTHSDVWVDTTSPPVIKRTVSQPHSCVLLSLRNVLLSKQRSWLCEYLRRFRNRADFCMMKSSVVILLLAHFVCVSSGKKQKKKLIKDLKLNK